jgi:SOS response regulatory protein OraA/RecX
MSSGKDPNQILSELLKSGKVSQAQIEKAKQMASQIQNTKD